MMALAFLVVLALVFAVVWGAFGDPNTKAKLGPDDTNAQEPEPFIVRHEANQTPDFGVVEKPHMRPTEELSREITLDLQPGTARGEELADSDLPETVASMNLYTDLDFALPSTEDPVSDPSITGLAITEEDDRPLEDQRSVTFIPDSSWTDEMAEEYDWSPLREEYPLPQGYGEDLVTALVRNPRSLYVYWERDGQGEKNLRSMLGPEEYEETTLCLRIFDVTAEEEPTRENRQSRFITVSEHDDHWFINEGIEPGHRYVISLERRTASGEFYLLSHTDPVHTPFDRPAEEGLYPMYTQQPDTWSGSPWR